MCKIGNFCFSFLCSIQILVKSGQMETKKLHANLATVYDTNKVPSKTTISETLVRSYTSSLAIISCSPRASSANSAGFGSTSLLSSQFNSNVSAELLVVMFLTVCCRALCQLFAHTLLSMFSSHPVVASSLWSFYKVRL